MHRRFSSLTGPLPALRVVVLIAVVSSSSVWAQPVPWNHPDGTAHWYSAVLVPSGIDWDAANDAALLARGHLATITSAEENAFVFSLVDDPAYWFSQSSGMMAGPWIGGVQPTGSQEPAGNWTWVTREPFTYVDWSIGQPNNLNGIENRLHFGGEPGVRVSSWNDLLTSDSLIGYVIEWDTSPDQTVGVFQNDSGAFDGYTLFGPLIGPQPLGSVNYDQTVLIDNAGRVVHSWSSQYSFGFAPYLLDNGDIIRSVNINVPGWENGKTGRIEQYAWDGTPTWEFEYHSPDLMIHHDIEVLPNGNVLMIAWDRKTAAQAIAEGRDPSHVQSELWPDMIIEVSPTPPSSGTIVWEWHAWDHLVQDFDSGMNNFGVVADHPELINVNYPAGTNPDWHHANGLDYNPQLDQIVLSVRAFDEIWVIDHSTTTQEAAGHTGGNSGKGGDLLYRWGNPLAYGRGTAADQRLFKQHDPRWIEPGLPGAGNLMVFNNGVNRPGGNASSVDEIPTPLNPFGTYDLLPGASYGPSAATWSYSAANPTDFYSSFISGAERQPNGNTLICDGAAGTLFEVTPGKETVWKYVNPLTSQGLAGQGVASLLCCNPVFRATRIAPGHPGLVGRNLTPGETVETYPFEIAARFGTVNTGAGGRADVLRINGGTGDVWREAYAYFGDPIALSIDAPPAGPAAADFVISALLFEPGIQHVHAQMAGFNLVVGFSCIPILEPGPQIILGSSVAGLTYLPTLPQAPVQILQQILPPGNYTVQGLLTDLGAGTQAGYSVSNAIVLRVL